MFMPRTASRLTLVVTGVKVERLQDISGLDTIAEGVQCATCEAMKKSACGGQGCFASSVAYRELWDRINTKPGTRWADNPWIVAVTFTVHKINVEAYLAQQKDAAA